MKKEEVIAKLQALKADYIAFLAEIGKNTDTPSIMIEYGLRHSFPAFDDAMQFANDIKL